MALIKCPGCGNDVSTHSTECPKCGEPIHCEMPTEEQRLKKKERLKKNMTSCLIEVGIFLTISIVGAFAPDIPHEYRIYSLTLPNIVVVVNLIKYFILLKKFEKE